MSDNKPGLLEARGISKSFPGVRALHAVDLSVARGEVLALVGENGAGKSTLMKILAGVQVADHGRVSIDGHDVRIRSVSDALHHGIALIHQELNLADNLDVGANVFLGREPVRRGFIQHRQIHRLAAQCLAMVGLNVSTHEIVGNLSIGQQQLVEIAKALSIDARVLIMDEPTSSLSATESRRLFEVIRDVRSHGVSIIYISHRLGEVTELADRVVVLRDGKNAGELVGSAIQHEKMVRLMVGRDISQFYARRERVLGEVVLEVKDLITSTWPGHPLNLSVRRGEIVGVAGLVGAGRTEMLRAIFGIDPNWRVRSVCTGPRSTASPRQAIGHGIALVPEDRKQHGLVIELPVSQNIGLAGLRLHQGFAGWLNKRREVQDTLAMIEQLNIKTPTPHQSAQFLSGGNQQKVVIAKWLSLQPRVLLMDEPTRGIDVGAKEEIYRLIETLAEQGLAILFVSSEMEEILGISDRVIVMHEGRITGELARNALTEEAVMRLATGDIHQMAGVESV